MHTQHSTTMLINSIGKKGIKSNTWSFQFLNFTNYLFLYTNFSYSASTTLPPLKRNIFNGHWNWVPRHNAHTEIASWNKKIMQLYKNWIYRFEGCFDIIVMTVCNSNINSKKKSSGKSYWFKKHLAMPSIASSIRLPVIITLISIYFFGLCCC